jgi:hypothetical protein
MADTRFAGPIMIAGVIDERGIHVEPAFASTVQLAAPAGNAPLRLAVDVVADQAILSRAHVVADVECHFRGLVRHSFETIVTLPAAATGLVVHSPVLNPCEVMRLPHDPRVDLAWQPKDGMIGRQEIAWQAQHPDNASLMSVVEYSNDDGQTWRRLTCPTATTSATINFDELPAGDLRLSVLVTDGLNNARAVSAPFTHAKTACDAVIVHPTEGARFAAGQPILAYGVGWSPSGQAVPEDLLSWKDESQQVIGRGSMVTLTLNAGKHRLVLVAGDQQVHGESDISIVVE